MICLRLKEVFSYPLKQQLFHLILHLLNFRNLEQQYNQLLIAIRISQLKYKEIMGLSNCYQQ
jgi:hypothetical protein